MVNGTRLKGITRLKDITRLKGELYGNPALQGGRGRPGRLPDGMSWGRIPLA